ncbi:MAG: OmpA family protein [Streptosporangiales bacterium]|nr:OmpA family protein [Streptosporangiales bacterium]
MGGSDTAYRTCAGEALRARRCRPAGNAAALPVGAEAAAQRSAYGLWSPWSVAGDSVAMTRYEPVDRNAGDRGPGAERRRPSPQVPSTSREPRPTEDQGSLIAAAADRGRALRASDLLVLQAIGGNAATAALLHGGHPGDRRVVQREPPGQVPAPAGPVSPPSPVPPSRLPDFGDMRFMEINPRFDLFYDPVGPLPAVGKVTITLKVHVVFKDFDRGMMRRPEFRRHRWTRDQLRDFKFPSDDKKKWVGKFATAVQDGWKEKHVFVLNDPGFASYRATCDVQVEHVDDPAQANTVIAAQWVPRGAPRLRSAVSGKFDESKTAVLDARDPDVPVTHKRKVRPAQLLRQIGPFDHDSAVINPAVQSGIDGFERRFRQLRKRSGPLDVPIDKIDFGFRGRATSPGSVSYNNDLSLRRANAVAGRMESDLGLPPQITIGVGEHNAGADPMFRRVDVSASSSAEIEVSQNVAAHEAGHMFGLGDEYVEEDAHKKGFRQKFEADRPVLSDERDEYQDVKDAMGEDAAEELLVQDGPSIMSRGDEVKRGHYVYFLESLNTATSKTWTVE